jgi:hypothetical protein
MLVIWLIAFTCFIFYLPNPEGIFQIMWYLAVVIIAPMYAVMFDNHIIKAARIYYESNTKK